MLAETSEQTGSQYESLKRKRSVLFVVFPLWMVAAVVRFATRSHDQSLTSLDPLLFGFVLISLVFLYFLLIRSIKYVSVVLTGMFFVLTISGLITLFVVLFSPHAGLIRESIHFLDLAFWFPLVPITAYLAFDLKKGLHAIIGFWLIAILALGMYIIDSPSFDVKMEKLAFFARFVIVNSVFILLVDLWARVNSFTISHEIRAQRQEKLANTDDLTGIPNRRSITTILEKEFRISKRTGSVFSVIAFDIRTFKQINDKFGHPYGDKVLIEVARTGGAIIRAVDTIARFGGDEFLILLTETNKSSARKVAERFKEVVRNIELPDGRKIEIAVGIASSNEHSDFTSMITAADNELYRSPA